MITVPKYTPDCICNINLDQKSQSTIGSSTFSAAQSFNTGAPKADQQAAASAMGYAGGESEASLQLIRVQVAGLAAGAAEQHDVRFPCDAVLAGIGAQTTDGVCIFEDIAVDFENFGNLQSFVLQAAEVIRDIATPEARFPITGFGFFKQGHVISMQVYNQNAAAAMDAIFTFYLRPTK